MVSARVTSKKAEMQILDDEVLLMRMRRKERESLGVLGSEGKRRTKHQFQASVMYITSQVKNVFFVLT